MRSDSESDDDQAGGEGEADGGAAGGAAGAGGQRAAARPAQQRPTGSAVSAALSAAAAALSAAAATTAGRGAGAGAGGGAFGADYDDIEFDTLQVGACVRLWHLCLPTALAVFDVFSLCRFVHHLRACSLVAWWSVPPLLAFLPAFAGVAVGLQRRTGARLPPLRALTRSSLVLTAGCRTTH